MYSLNGGAAFESQVTLVDTSAYGTPQTVLSFVRDDMKNTKITSLDDRLLYTVETDKQTNTHTKILRGDTAEVVAELKRKDLRPDRIKFGTNQSIKLSQFLKGNNGKWSDFPVSFEWNSNKYTWRANSARQIALYDESDLRIPIAWFQTSRRETVEGVPTLFRALLALRAEAQEILDGLVISLLVVEYGLRYKEQRFQNADGRATFKVYF